MPNTKIRSFFRDPNCSICGSKVRGWARRQCDNCGALVCARHRPPLITHWECPDCKKRQQQFLGTPEVGTQIGGPPAPRMAPDMSQLGYTISTSASLDQALRTAEALYSEGRMDEGDNVTDQLLLELYC